MALLIGAVVWGLIWYPYRLLADMGVSPLLAATLTYSTALLIAAWFLRRALRGTRPTVMLVLIGLSAGACNVGYVLATVHGEVMRVLLLFYLAPLWTVLLSRVLLKERLDVAGALVVLLSLAGAALMLWQPALGLPVPQSFAEWMGLAAGFFFALSNVLVRKTSQYSIPLKSMAIFIGVVVVGLFGLVLEGGNAATAVVTGVSVWGLLLAVGVVLFGVNIVVQYGLTHTPANRAIVIFLFELVVAALSSWLLAGETLGAREWVGAAMIISASLFSGRVGAA